MDFVSGIEPPAENHKPAWWFVYKGGELLVRVENGSAVVPAAADLDDLRLEPQRQQYLGTWGGRPCYSAELADGTSETPRGLTFLPLRKLFSLLDLEAFGMAGRAAQIIGWDRDHQFCGRCGAPTESKKDERAKACPQCGLLSFPRISPAVIVAVVRQDKLLLAHAKHFPDGMHSVLAGFVEPGETLEECVKREVKEEVGLEVDNIRYFGSQPWPFPHSLMVGFTASNAGGEICIDDAEIGSAAWFSADRLPRIPDRISIARQLIDWFVAGGR